MIEYDPSSRLEIAPTVELLPASYHNAEALKVIERYEDLWIKIQLELQEPTRMRQYEASGYTGHRHVVFDETDAQYALGFQLHYTLSGRSRMNERTISAYWRRLYPADIRLVNYESGEYHVAADEIVPNQRKLDKLESLYDLYMSSDRL